MGVKRFEVYVVDLEPTQGSEIQKVRPCVVISPDDLNQYISTVIVAPMTTRGKNYPTRIACHFQKKTGQIVLDQIRTVDKVRLRQKLGRVSAVEQRKILATLAELFAE